MRVLAGLSSALDTTPENLIDLASLRAELVGEPSIVTRQPLIEGGKGLNVLNSSVQDRIGPGLEIQF